MSKLVPSDAPSNLHINSMNPISERILRGTLTVLKGVLSFSVIHSWSFLPERIVFSCFYVASVWSSLELLLLHYLRLRLYHWNTLIREPIIMLLNTLPNYPSFIFFLCCQSRVGKESIILVLLKARKRQLSAEYLTETVKTFILDLFQLKNQNEALIFVALNHSFLTWSR